jgi:hypothetical protein
MPPEKYSLADLHEFLRTGRIEPILWMAYFSETLDMKIPTCEDCLASREESCPGGMNPVDCFLAK